jgi:hypothetical protein
LRVVLLQFVLLTPLFPAEGGLDSLATPSISVITDEDEVKMRLFNSSLKVVKERKTRTSSSNNTFWIELFGPIILLFILTEWNRVNSVKDDRIQDAECKKNFDRFCSISLDLGTNVDLPSQKFVDVLRPLLHTGKFSQTGCLIIRYLNRE